MNNLSTPHDEKENIITIYDPRINETIKSIMNSTLHGETFNAENDISKKYNDIALALYGLIEEILGIYMANVIVTGKFGRFFHNWIQCFGFDYDTDYLIEDGESLEIFKEKIEGHDYVIVHDTVPENHESIKNHLNSLGGIYKGTFVIYNQQEGQPQEIYSLY
jgi:hypothetical protein